MNNVPWKHQFPQAFQRVRLIPLARNLDSAQWMFLALESGFITSNEYLPWAQKYYGLASIKSDFFRNIFHPSIYLKYKDDSSAWGPQALPIFEWDEIVFVACVDPHSVPSQLNFRCRPLLAQYEDLVSAWNVALNALKNPQSVQLPPPLYNENRINSANTPELSKDIMTPTETSGQELPEAIQASPPVLSPNLNFEAPIENRDFSPHESLKTPKDDQNLFELLDNAESDTQSNSISPTEEEMNLEMPEGLNFNVDLNKLQSEEKLNVYDTILAKQQTSDALPSQPDVLNADDPFGNLAVPPLPPQTFKDLNAISNRTQTPEPLTEHIVSTPSQALTVTFTELEEELKHSFAKAYQCYRNLMVLKIEGDKLTPFRWDPSYKNYHPIKEISLNEPSIFRIVVRTQKPFHGSVSPNAINNQFLQNWFIDHQPKYLTLVPLFFEKNCIGVLLGASDEPLHRKDSVHLMESTAHMVEANFAAKLVA